jgi:hypothetical protein
MPDRHLLVEGVGLRITGLTDDMRNQVVLGVLEVAPNILGVCGVRNLNNVLDKKCG